MAKPRADVVFQRIIQRFDVNTVGELNDLIVDALMSLDENMVDSEALDISHLMIERVRRQRDKYLDKCSDKKIPPVFSKSRYPDRLIGRCHILNDDDEEDIRKKKILLEYDKLIECLPTLDEDQFEIVSCLVLDLEGCEDIQRAVRTRDKAIDLFGYREMDAPVTRLKFISGATRSEVGDEKIREFHRSIDQVEDKDREMERIFPPAFLEDDRYVHGYFFTARSFSNVVENAQNEDRYKLSRYDGAQMAAIILREEIAIDEELNFSCDELKTYLDGLNLTYPLYEKP